MCYVYIPYSRREDRRLGPIQTNGIASHASHSSTWIAGPPSLVAAKNLAKPWLHGTRYSIYLTVYHFNFRRTRDPKFDQSDCSDLKVGFTTALSSRHYSAVQCAELRVLNLREGCRAAKLHGIWIGRHLQVL